MPSNVSRGGLDLPFIAGADLSAKQYKVVKPGTNSNEVVLSSAATDKSIGVLQNAPVQNEAANVRMLNGGGTTRVVAGGSISKGAYLKADSNGDVVSTTTAGDVIVGQALEDADDNDEFEMLLLPGFHHKA